MLWALLGLWGCSGLRANLASDTPYVKAIHIEGNEREGNKAAAALLEPFNPTGDRVLEDAMEQTSMRLPLWREPPTLAPSSLEEDALRLEVWYAHHGYFDARVADWQVLTVDPLLRRPFHRITGVVQPGEPSRLSAVEITGLDTINKTQAQRVRAQVYIAPGQIFSLVDFQASQAALLAYLQRNAYAFATVESHVEVDARAHTVVARYDVHPGKASTFGRVYVTGNTSIADARVLQELSFQEGDPWSTDKIAESRSQLFSLRAFSLVNIVPDLSHPESGRVPIRVEVREAKPRSLRVGVEASVEAGTQSFVGATEFRHENLLGRLWKLSAGARGGVARVDALSGVRTEVCEGDAPQDDSFLETLQSAEVSPVGQLSLGVETPHLGGTQLSFAPEGSVERGAVPGYDFTSWEAAPLLKWKHALSNGNATWYLQGGWRLQYFDYEFTVPVERLRDRPESASYADPYVLSQVEGQLIFDGRNNRFTPTRGLYTEISASQAGGPFGGTFNFLRVQGEARRYQSLNRLTPAFQDTVLASRAAGGFIQPFNDAGVPYAERLYLGGGDTVRGWGANRLGPTVEVRNESTCEIESIPAGGLVSMYGNLEVRQKVYPGTWAAAFVDTGRVWESWENTHLSGLQWSAGLGGRYETPVGPARLDVACRFGDAPNFANDPRCAVHLGLSEAF